MSPLFVFSYVLLWILVAVLAIAVVALYNHLGTAYLSARENRANAGPAEGSHLRGIEAATVDGRPVLLPPALRPAVVLFVSTTCSLCAGVRQAIPNLTSSLPDVDVLIFCQGRPQMVRVWANDILDLAAVVADRNGRLTTRYEVDLLPFGVGVGLDGIVRARGIVNKYEDLEALANAALDREQSVPATEGGSAHAHS